MSTDKKTTESYNDYAEKWAERMRSGNNIAHEYLEKPAMYGKLLSLTGLDILCIGCGTGEECQHLKSLGANRVVGIDISDGLIEYAKKSYPDLEFKVMDMEKLDFPAESFDLIYSSLVMHYVDSWEQTLKLCAKVLKKNGRFLFSTHHPVTWGANRTRTETERTSLLGYKKFKDSGTCDVIGDYLNIRKTDDIWFGDFKVTYFHRSLQEILKDILKSNFEIIDYLEPRPVEKCKEVDPVFWEIHQKIPLFMIFELRKKQDINLITEKVQDNMRINIAYIDATNLDKALRNQLKWQLDYKRFRVWLKEKYDVERAYIFIGLIPKYKSLYSYLQECGFELAFKDVTYAEGKVKGNCDSDLLMKTSNDFYEGDLNKAIIVASDGDYAPLIKVLHGKSRLEVVLSPSTAKKCSILLKRTGAPIAYIDDQRFILELKPKHEVSTKEKAPNADGTA